VDEELDDEILGDEYMTLQDTFASVAARLPAVQLPSEPSKPFANMAYNTLDFKALVCQRKQHQTRQAAKSARVKYSESKDESSTAPVESTRRQILRKYHELLKEDQSKAVGTAVERQARWSTDPKHKAGNAANAAAVASAVATKVSPISLSLLYVTRTEQAATRRKKLFRDAHLAPPLLAMVTNAGLTHFKPVVIGSFGFIWTELGLRVGKGQCPFWKFSCCMSLSFCQLMLFIAKAGGKMANMAPSPSITISVLSRTSTSKSSSFGMLGPFVLTPKQRRGFRHTSSLPSPSSAVFPVRQL
jgi:hypothetical protein